MSETEKKEAEMAACCHVGHELSPRSCLKKLLSACVTEFWVQPYFFVLQHDPEAFPDTEISRVVEGSSFLRATAGPWDDEKLTFGC